MFSEALIKALVDAANANGITPSRLLALVEVETGPTGKTFEQDGRTPALLYERHVAYREAKARGSRLLAAFVRAGLAIPKWSRSTQYKDQGTSAGRLKLISNARAIDNETADRSASWGVGQTMGFHAEEVGFANACAMVDYMTGNLAGQIEIMIRDLRNKRLIDPLNRGDWAKVARIYNGSGYAANAYDVRLADADKRWQRKLAAPFVDPMPGMTRDEIEAVQVKLFRLGYKAIGTPDGRAGIKTIGALSSFQAHEGLPRTGLYDDATREALRTALPVEQPAERKMVTAAGLKAAGSRTIKAADGGGLLAKLKVIGGGSLVAAGTAGQVSGFLDTAQSGIDKVNQAKSVATALRDLIGPIVSDPAVIVAGVILIVSGVAVYVIVERIKALRVADHASGAHAGVWE